jgi:ABC-type transporter Mla MlaB component
MLKITRSTEAGTTTLALSGRVGSEHLPDLRRCLEEGRGEAIVLDLGEVTLVDVDVVRFLVECQTRAIRLAQCPGYVREWMVREKPLSE